MYGPAEDLGIPTAMFYSWRTKRNQCDQPLENKKLQESELMSLKLENARLEDKNSFLKKAAVYFAKSQKRTRR